MGLSSNVLWHQTKEASFYKILKSRKILYSYSLERIIPSYKLQPVAFPMISACNYPLAEIGNNDWRYGNYCIGFKQDWGVKVGFSPVWYCSYGSNSLRLVDILLEDAIKSNTQGHLGAVMMLFSNMKFDQAPLETHRTKFENYRFYDEHEWRVVPFITKTDNAGVLPFLTEKGYKEYKEKNGSSRLEIGASFEFDDIHYIIVEKEEDIQKTIDVVGDRIHIFTKDEIIEDVIGVGHHEEILPSQEQLDYEAAQRHVDRLRKLTMEALEKWQAEKRDGRPE